MKDEIETLNGQDTEILNKQGWHFIIRYKSKEAGTGSNAHNNAIDKAKSIQRPTGIRVVEKDDYTLFEVWEYWK